MPAIMPRIAACPTTAACVPIGDRMTDMLTGKAWTVSVAAALRGHCHAANVVPDAKFAMKKKRPREDGYEAHLGCRGRTWRSLFRLPVEVAASSRQRHSLRTERARCHLWLRCRVLRPSDGLPARR